ncbi:MAG: pyridoxamine 5'-phosphate oxidase family protein, partial [Selenomonadaceae bacterium]|nr:pyridoxamine 5'-phosphate oxidase family protein [Selenomonadaceae bacterium]
MFREMRRSKQVLSQETAEKILREGEFGVLALSGDDGYSYAVPINYAVEGNKIYFHSAKVGHKLDAIKRNEKVSFCVVDRHEVIAEEFT